MSLKDFSLKKLLSLILMLSLSTFVFTACEDDPEEIIDPDDPIEITVEPVGNTYAGQSGATAITVGWEHSPSIAETWFKGYLVRCIVGGVTDSEKEVSRVETQVTFTDLDVNNTYDFEILAIGTNPETSVEVLSAVKKIQWALATHYTLNVNDAAIRVYTGESSFGSGLVFYSSDGNAPRSSITVANGLTWNLGMGRKDNPVIGSSNILKSENIYTGGDFGNANFASNSQSAAITQLMDFDSGSLTDLLLDGSLQGMDFQQRVINLNTDPKAQAASKGVVFFAKTKDNHYVKVVVLKKGGVYVQDNAGSNPYVELLISYQRRQNVPYAKQ